MLLTFPKISDLNGLTIVLANPGPTCAYDLTTNWHQEYFLMFFYYFSQIISFGFQLPAVQPCNWVGVIVSLSLLREGAILVLQDENEITYFSWSSEKK